MANPRSGWRDSSRLDAGRSVLSSGVGRSKQNESKQIDQSCGSSGGRNLYFLASAWQAASGFIPAVQDGSESDAAAAHTAVSRQRLRSQPSCNPSKTPAQNASPAPALPAM